jgi:hypothetical protein
VDAKTSDYSRDISRCKPRPLVHVLIDCSKIPLVFNCLISTKVIVSAIYDKKFWILVEVEEPVQIIIG